jgi:WD40 repeat protein
MRLFDTETGAELKSIERDELSKMRSMARISWDGTLAATWGRDGIIRLLETETGRDVGILGPQGAAIRSGAFASGDDLLATSDSQGKVIVWDLVRRTARAVQRGHSGPVWPIDFSHDGRSLCTSCGDNRIRIWDVAREPTVVDVCQGHQSIVPCLAFSPDGRLVASGGDEAGGGHLKFWDVATGQFQFQLVGHTARIWSVAFSPDGTELASTGNDGTIRVWDLKAQRLSWTIEPDEKVGRSWIS